MRFSAGLALFICSLTAAFGQSTGYVLLLNDPPAAQSLDRSRQALDRGRNLAAHALLRAQLASRNIRVTAEASTLVNAIFVKADASRLDELRALPGVKAVTIERRFHLTLDRAEQLINVPAAWSALGGVGSAGTGIRIGVIDTGIESTHPSFQDPTLPAPAGYPICAIYNQPQVPLDCSKYTNGKVIVARSYVPILVGADATTNRPDDVTPRDHVGHGTAVATAAGGAPAAITGVAPKAWLGSYKVFGSPGVSDFTSGGAVVAALEDALLDHMNVVILSLGAPALFGPLDQNCGNGVQVCDTEAIAVQNAVSQGMVVVAAAGNGGPTVGSASSPGDAPSAITVAALTNSHNWSNGLNVDGLGNFRALLGNGPPPAGGSLTAPLSDAGNFGDPQACSPLQPASLSGAIAVVQRGTCLFSDKVLNLQAAGAVGAVITNKPGDDSIFSPGGLAGGPTIPATLVGYSDGESIRARLQAAPGVKATILSALQPFDVSTGNRVSTFSARGPALGTGGIKPDIAAVGADLYLSGQTYDPNGSLYSSTGYLVSQGTSFSAPQVAGVAALVLQGHPGLAANAVRSAIVDTAIQDVTDNGAPASMLAAGAGRANAAAALAADVVAVPADASFGIWRAGTPAAKQIQLTNLSSSTKTLSLSVNPVTAESTAHVVVDRANITIGPNQTSSFNISISGSRPVAGSYQGFVTVQGGASSLRIPYLYSIGDGVPATITALIGDGDDGTVGQSPSIGYLVLQLMDQYGVPVSGSRARFSVVAGGGSIPFQQSSTDSYGIAFATVVLGPNPGANTYQGVAGGLTATFNMTARPQPVIPAGGVVDAASFKPGAAVAPGSYVAIFGTALSAVTQVVATPNLPVALNNVSVGFTAGSTNAPGHLHFVTPGQVNVQVPWELAGQTSAQMKVAVQDSSGNLYTLPLAAYSPGMFPITLAGAPYAAALDENFAIIGPSNPAKQGRNIQLYCNGLGPVSNQPASGDPALGEPFLSRTSTTPVVTIGGQNASVLFSGLTPTTVGLYQINVTVPAVGAGVQSVTISIGGVTSKTENIVVAP